MAISSADVVAGPYLSNGSTDQFSFSFRVADYGDVEAEDQVKVILVTIATGAETVLTRGVSAGQFLVSVNGDQDSAPGGSITTNTVYPSGFYVYVRLKPTFTQQTELTAQTGYNGPVHERAFDQLQSQINDLNDRVRRSPVAGVQIGESFIGEITGAPRAGYIPQLNAGLTGFDWVANNGSSGLVTATGSTTARTLADRFGRMLTPEDFGAVGDGTDDAAELQAWLDCGEKFLTCEGGTYGVGTMLTIPPGVHVFAAGATFKPTANVNIMRLHGGAMLTGVPIIDVTDYSGWSSICVLFDGSSEAIEANNFRVHTPTVAEVYCIGVTTGTGNGTAVKLNAEDDGVNDSWIMGTHVRLFCLGFDKMYHIAKGGTSVERAFINSNYLEYDATYPLQTIVIESAHASSYSVDRNIFVGASQSRPQSGQTAVPLVLAGQYNVYDIMQWDWLGGDSTTVQGITIASGARGNRISTFMNPVHITNNSTERNRIFNDYHTLGYDYFGTIVPIKNDGGALGTSALSWSDAFFASGAVLSFNNGDVTITHSSNALTGAGGRLAWANNVGAATEAFQATNSTDNSFVLAAQFAGARATPANNDTAYINLRLNDDAGNTEQVARLLWRLTDVANGSEDGDFTIGVVVAGTIANKVRVNGTSFHPVTAADVTLGASANPFGPIYFRPGASVTPANNTDVVFELTNNTTLTFKAKGSDGTVRSGTVTLA